MRVQRQPRSLLALLGVVGENPPGDTAQDYRLTIEQIEFILLELEVGQQTVTNAATSTGGSAVVTVPEGEMWFLLQAFGTIPGAGPAVSNVLTINVGRAGAGQFQVAVREWIPDVTFPAGAVAAFGEFVEYVPPIPTILRPGDSVRAVVHATTSAVAQSLTATAQFRRVQV